MQALHAVPTSHNHPQSARGYFSRDTGCASGVCCTKQRLKLLSNGGSVTPTFSPTGLELAGELRSLFSKRILGAANETSGFRTFHIGSSLPVACAKHPYRKSEFETAFAERGRGQGAAGVRADGFGRTEGP